MTCVCDLREDREKFNEALVDALRWHKEYWTASDDRAINIESSPP
jgi:hypothetical protein